MSISFSWIACSSKTLVLNLSRFSCGMGFIILVFRDGGGCVILAIRVFGGIFRMIDRWSELRF